MKIGFEGTDRNFGARFLNEVKALFAEGDAIECVDPFDPSTPDAPNRCDLVFVANSETVDLPSARSRAGAAVFVALASEGEPIPQAFIQGDVEDVLSLPLRPVDVFALFRRLRVHSELRGLAESQNKIQVAVERLESDVNLAEQLQKAVLPIRFPDVRGFKVRQRYLAGLRGGDWFDIAETRDGSALHLVLSDGSSSGLSSAVGASLTRVAMKVSLETARDPLPTVRALHDELQAIFTEKHRMSLLYGVLLRSELKLKYLSLGKSRWIYQPHGQGFRFLESQGPILQKGQILDDGIQTGEISLAPQDRLILVSDGFIDGLGGEAQLLESLEKAQEESKERSLEEILNEWAWGIRQSLSDDELPPQECSALGLEIDSRIIRLARK